MTWWYQPYSPGISDSGNAYEIAADAGSYAITGSTASLEHGYEVAADAGSYAITGSTATLVRALPIVATGGSYAITGATATLLATRIIAADTGSYAVTGADVALEHGYEIDAAAGSYAITGSDVTLTYTQLGAYEIIADSGVYTLTGSAAALEYGYAITALGGSYEITGSDATLEYAPVAEVQQGGGWLHPSQIRADEEHRDKRRKRLKELEETIAIAYQRLTGKITTEPIIEAAKDNPVKLAVQAEKLAAQLVTKSNNSARLRTRNAQIIADLQRQANEILIANQLEEEAIVMLLLT